MTTQSAGHHPFKLIVYLTALLIVLAGTHTNLNARTLVSLKQPTAKAIAVQNPVNLMELPPDTVLQINHPQFILQFLVSGQKIRGIIFKRNLDFPIHIRWCFFRNCEESVFDYKTVLAQPHEKPFNEDFFRVMLPVKFNYKFQGLHFTAGFPSKY